MDDAAERWVAMHGSAVWVAIHRLTAGVDHAAREDCFQETFIEFWSLSRKTQVAFPRAMLVRIATRRAIDLLRRRTVDGTRFPRGALAEPLSCRGGGPDQRLRAGELSTALIAALRMLPEKQAAVFCMTQLEQLPPAEVAAAMGRSPAAVAVLLRRARVKLQKALANWAPPGHVNHVSSKGAEHVNEPIDRLHAATAELRDRPIPPGPSVELLDRTVTAMNGSQIHDPHRHWFVMSAAAAAILVIVGLLFMFLDRAMPLAFAEVIQQVTAAEQAQRTMTFTSGGGEAASRGYLKGTRLRVEGNTPDGVGRWISIRDLSTGDDFMIIPQQRAAYWHHYVPRLTATLYEKMRDMARRTVKPIGEKDDAGRKLAGFTGTMLETDNAGRQYEQPVNVWVDPVTRLPRFVEEFDPITGKSAGTFADIRFDVPLNDDLFAFNTPADFELRDLRTQDAQQLRPPTTLPSETFVLRPGTGMGDLKLGDSLDRVVALLGLPEKDDDEIYKRFKQGKLMGGTIWYPSLGLRIFVDLDRLPDGKAAHPLAGRRMVVHSICADNVNPLWAGRAFAGATSEGIRIGSTRADVEFAYGKADWENAANAEYRQRGLAIFFQQGGKFVSGFLIVPASNKPIFAGAEQGDAPTTKP